MINSMMNTLDNLPIGMRTEETAILPNAGEASFSLGFNTLLGPQKVGPVDLTGGDMSSADEMIGNAVEPVSSEDMVQGGNILPDQLPVLGAPGKGLPVQPFAALSEVDQPTIYRPPLKSEMPNTTDKASQLPKDSARPSPLNLLQNGRGYLMPPVSGLASPELAAPLSSAILPDSSADAPPDSPLPAPRRSSQSSASLVAIPPKLAENTSPSPISREPVRLPEPLLKDTGESAHQTPPVEVSSEKSDQSRGDKHAPLAQVVRSEQQNLPESSAVELLPELHERFRAASSSPASSSPSTISTVATQVTGLGGTSTPNASNPEPLNPQHRQLETLIDNLAEARENGRSARGDMLLRHAEFGSVAMRIDQVENDLTARLSSRDPAFAAAAQAALNERSAVTSTSETTTGNQRGNEQSSTAGQSRDGGMSNGGGRTSSGQGQDREHGGARHHATASQPTIVANEAVAAWLAPERGHFA